MRQCPLPTLKNKKDFQRVKTGIKISMPLFLVQAIPQMDGDTVTSSPRVGYILPKKLGNAVLRNRIRRRLREALRTDCRTFLLPYDYVLLPRAELATSQHARLVEDLQTALTRLHKKLSP